MARTTSVPLAGAAATAFAGAGAGGLGAGVRAHDPTAPPRRITSIAKLRLGRRGGEITWSRLQAVPRLPDGENVSWLRRIVLELPSQLGDMNVYRPRHDFNSMPPDLAQQLDPRRHRAAAPHERQE